MKRFRLILIHSVPLLAIHLLAPGHLKPLSAAARQVEIPAPATAPSSTSPAFEVFPVLVVDKEHAIDRVNGSGKPYLIGRSSGLVLDARGADLHDPKGLLRRPNVVRVIVGNAEYHAAIDGQQGLICRLDSDSLRGRAGEPFKGFGAGGQAYVAIGYADGPASPVMTAAPAAATSRPSTEPAGEGSSALQSGSFEPFWIGSVIFR